METKQYEITVKIQVSVPDDGALGMTADQWAQRIATDYANLASNKSIGAELVLAIDVKRVE